MSLYRLRQSLLSRKGATSVEYLVAIILIVLVVMGIIKLFGPTINQKFKSSGSTVSKIDGEKGYQVAQKNKSNSKIVIDGRAESDTVDANAKKDGKGGAVKKKGYKYEDKTPTAQMLPSAKKKKAGFNPLILIIFLALGGLLGFVMYKGNRQEG